MRATHQDLTGKRFGRLTVIQYEGCDFNKITLWRVRCDCGCEFTAARSNLVSGATKSCGCLKKDLLRLRANKMAYNAMKLNVTPIINNQTLF